ncbi:type II toxin-antitoxin system HigB family toxin [Candidatus Poribacteria bacterium]|nr:type II toxin-antitoxin system HigB family toxin [Candidatus Poribacteria bacterium]
MRIISVKKLREFWGKHSDSEQPLRAWYAEAKKSNWNNPKDIKRMYCSVSILKDNRVVFNIKGNTYRLVTAINYDYKIVFIRFIGTHREYDRINAEEV